MTAQQTNIPQIPLIELNTLWFQVSGTVCNLECSHCFISCGPDVSRHKMMTRDTIKKYLREAEHLPVKEYYLTGGETFMNPELPEIVNDMLELGDVTVLTNATLITEKSAEQLSDLQKMSKYRLGFRVSIESPFEEENDRVRGKGSFNSAKKGIKNLYQSGFNPIITSTLSEHHTENMEGEFIPWLNECGITEPKHKTLPMIYLGRAEKNIRPYRDEERVTEACFNDFSKSMLHCSYCRMITSEGIYACPILIDEPTAKMGTRLLDSLKSYSLQSQACYTCRTSGLCCANTTVTRDDVMEFYSKAAEKPQPTLCCPTIYNKTDISHIPEEVLEISYGCGSPVSMANIQTGETMLDLGSGGGIDCFIAAKSVGARGRVIGVDMTDEMLSKAAKNKVKITDNLGYDNLEFRKGVLENIPAESNSINVVTSNCVINLSVNKRQVFKEIYRIIDNGGRFVISDIISSESVPEKIKANKELWGECVSGAMTLDEFMVNAIEAGFYGITTLSHTHFRTLEGIRFDSITFMGHKQVKGDQCIYVGQQAIYKGPFSSVTDDENHIFPRGKAVEVCTDTAKKLQKTPYADIFELTDPNREDGKNCDPGCC